MGLFDRTKAKGLINDRPITQTIKQESRLGFGNRNNALKSLKDIAKYNPVLSASIRAIVMNCLRVDYTEWKGQTQIENSPMTNCLLSPSPFLDRDAVLSQMFFDYLFWGSAYAKIDKTGDTITLSPIPYIVIKPVFDKTESGMYDLSTKRYEVQVGGKTQTLTKDDVFEWSDYSYGIEDYRGVPRIIHLLYSVVNSDNADRFNESFIANGGVPSGFFATETTNIDVLQKLRDDYQKSHASPDKAGAMGFMGGSAKWVQTGAGMSDMAFEVLKEVSIKEILAVYNTPPLLLGITNDVNYAISQTQRKLFIEVTVKPVVDSFASAFEAKIKTLYPGRAFGELYADTDSFPEMQDDLLKKLQIAQMAVYMGYDLADVSAKLNLPFDVPTAAPVQTPPVAAGYSFGVVKSDTRNEYRETLKLLMHERKVKAERTYTLDLEKYYVAIRNQLLDKAREIDGKKSLVGDYANELMLFANEQMSKWNRDLKFITGKYFGRVTDEVAQKLISDMGLLYRQTAQEAFVLATRTNKIVRVNETTFKLLDESMRTAIANGESYSSAFSALEINIRSVLEQRKAGAATIAQTEGNGYANEVVDISYRDNGVEKISWLTSRDELVRPAHAAIDGEVIDINGLFSNGLRYPGDQNGDAAEVVNCRCGTIPEN